MNSAVQRFIRVLLVVVIICALAAFAFESVYGQETLLGLVAPSSMRYVPADSIRLFAYFAGSEAAYERYIRAADEAPIIVQHAAAHAIGEVLYEREGASGALAICDTSYNFGCVHQVLGKALEEGGPESFEGLIEDCRRLSGVSFGACAHGIGHGLTYVSGYVATRLEDDLEACDRIHAGRDRLSENQSCYVGVFMEYNERFMLEAGPRPPAEDPRFPCSELSDTFHRNTCLFWNVPYLHWAWSDYAYDEAAFEKLGVFCGTETGAAGRDACFGSIGRSTGFVTDFSPRYARTLCESASDNEQDMASCMKRAAHVRESNGFSDQSKAVCELSPKQQSCLAFEGLVTDPARPR